MFTKPEHGWTRLQLGDYTDRASYLTDVPNDCFEAFIEFFKTYKPQAIEFEAEGWTRYLVLNECYTTATTLNLDDLGIAETYIHYINIEDLAEEFINDVESNYNEWQNWMCFDNELNDFSQDIKKLKECILHYKNK